MKNKLLSKDPEVSNVLEDAKRKLKAIENNQKQAEKYFKDKENFDMKLKLLESNLKKKINNEKKSNQGFEEKTIDKIHSLLKNLSSIDPYLLNKVDEKYKQRDNKECQTDTDDTQAIRDKLSRLEKKHEGYLVKKANYKKEIELLKIEVDQLKSSNDKLIKENKLLQTNLEDSTKVNNQTETKLIEALKNNDILLNRLKNEEKLTLEFSELKKAMEEKILLESDKLELEEKLRREAIEYYRGNIQILLHFKMIHHVTEFLKPKEIFNLKLCNKAINQSILSSNLCLKHLYMNVIDNLKTKIREFSQFDIQKEYLVNDTEVERLVKEYVTSKKISGKELRNTISKCITFLNKDVKAPLGMKISNSGTPKLDRSGEKTPIQGFMGGFKSMFSNMVSVTSSASKEPSSGGNATPKPRADHSLHSSGSKGDSRGMSILINSNEQTSEIDRLDKFIINDHLQYDNLYDFDYANPDEIKIILNKFLKSNFTTERLTAFIKEICLEYSELLYFANKSMMEIRDLEMIKDALNERFKRYHKMYTQLEKEYSEISTKNQTRFEQTPQGLESINDKQKEISQGQDVSLDVNVAEMQEKKISMLNDKYDELYSEYQSFKSIFVQEIRYLKFDLDQTIKQRNSLRDIIIEFKKHFQSIQIKE